MVAGDPRWRGTREQEKRRELAKKFYVEFRREEDDETRYARLAKRLSTTYREEEASAGSHKSNGRGNGWVDLMVEGLISAEGEFENKMELLRWFYEDGIPKEEQEEIEFQTLEDYANKLRGRAKRLGGGRDPWRKPPGGLTVSQYDNGLRRACKTCAECQASLFVLPTQRCTQSQTVKKLVQVLALLTNMT